jgi:hypothetical protein
MGQYIYIIKIMCGIAGILSIKFSPTLLTDRLELMQKALQHRGPDDEGIYISPDRQAALAHTRLSILDLSSAGHQPMSTDDGRYSSNPRQIPKPFSNFIKEWGLIVWIDCEACLLLPSGMTGKKPVF